MKTNAFFLSATLVAASLFAGDPLTELVPMPRQITAGCGTVDACALGNVTCIRGDIPGAPQQVAVEAYRLEIATNGVTIVAPSRLGELHARTTLGQLERLADGKVPVCTVVDWPRFRWRGCMLDTARNYLTLGALKDVIDMMAAYKLNLFHWHFTEDNGWRLESKRHPELQAPQAFYDTFCARGGCKFYTHEEFREIVRYAAERGVTVMPEFDVPGHCLAFRRAIGRNNMADPLVETTVADLIDELCSLVPPELMPFVHLGGDEVWQPHEKCAEGAYDRWAQKVNARGRTVMIWNPEQKTSVSNHIQMIWSSAKPEGDAPCIDAAKMYIEEYDPFSLLPAVIALSPCSWDVPDSRKLGAVFAGWHDSAAGADGDITIRNQCVMPSCVLFGELYWRGGGKQDFDYRIRLPETDDPRFAQAVDLERRVVAQRDKVLRGLKRAFPFLAQTQMRWRLSRPDGTVVAPEVRQATIYFHPTLKPSKAFVPETNGTVVAETWIKAPNDMNVGAWIGFTAYDRDHGRSRSAPLPKLGQWNIFDAKAELNGEPIAPPVWRNPGADRGKYTLVYCWSELTDRAFENEEYFTRPPTPIRLKAGWNHVKLTVPFHPSNPVLNNWVATFIPVLGTTEHPREVPGLEYSSVPRP